MPRKNEFYTMGKWKGLDQWRCSKCEYTTLRGEANLLDHYTKAHIMAPPKAKPPIIQAYDRFGNPIDLAVKIEPNEGESDGKD